MSEHIENLEADDRRLVELRAAASDADAAWQAERERIGDQITDAVVERNMRSAGVYAPPKTTGRVPSKQSPNST